MVSTILNVVQAIVSVLLIVVILLQQKGAGMGAGFGGGSGPVVTTRRGLDLFLHKLTIGIVFVFFVLSLAQLFI
ncbi:preprotein translocase subunit SecG [Patescibacteria group bacterium]|nr:preprotein translocase subunit SecG [Patescibacteria group bacterium]MBU1721183.1 preprotein translocase subunit SecG [Patescibacteria group bacterium]MBU1901109.1 preprotein translocase subunit SecG [Patescibacteria group bacterium]